MNTKKEHNRTTQNTDNCNTARKNKIHLLNTKKKRIILLIFGVAFLLCIIILGVKPFRLKVTDILKQTFMPISQAEDSRSQNKDADNDISNVISANSDSKNSSDESQNGSDVTGLMNDYDIQNDSITFKTDNSNKIIPCDLSAQDLRETLDFYGSDYSIPSTAFSIKEDTCAFWYGQDPKLYITNNGGINWNCVPFDVPKDMPDCTSRAVCFVDGKNGFAALGTPYSMGVGEWNKIYVTNDGGVSWRETNAVDTNINATLGDIAFADKLNGVVCYHSPSYTNGIPLTYCTTDGGENYQKFSLPEYSDEIDLSNLYTEKLEYLNGVYTLTLGTNDVDNHKLTYTSTDMLNWTYVKLYTADIHTVG